MVMVTTLSACVDTLLNVKNQFSPLCISDPLSLCVNAWKMASTGCCHLIMARIGSCHSHKLSIHRTPRILRKSKSLIGRELRIVASDWWRGLSEHIQRGYTYDPQQQQVFATWKWQEPVLATLHWQLPLENGKNLFLPLSSGQNQYLLP